MALVSTAMHLRSLSPGPDRFMTMNLMSAGPCTVEKDYTSYGRAVRRMRTRDNHTTADVDGARTFLRASAFTNKPDSYGISDIKGTTSMRLHRDTNKPDRQLYLDDIEGSKPRNKFMFRTSRCVNPLVPEYSLPSFAVAPPVAKKFTHDSYDVSDIEGTRPRPLYPLALRENNRVDDIEGARPGWKPRHQRARHDSDPLDHSLNVRDITGGGFRTRRATNPLTPSYRVNGMDIRDDPVKSRPRGLPKAKDGPFYPLTTLDIEGAQPGWRPMPQMNPPLEARRHFRNTNFTGDIPGAQADTVKHSICTERHVNLLDPVYVSLDGELLTNPQTPLYKGPAFVEAEEQLDRSIRTEDAIAVANAEPVTTPMPEHAGHNESRKVGNQGAEAEQARSSPITRTRERPSSDPLPSSSGYRKRAGREDGETQGEETGAPQDGRMPASSARATGSSDSRDARIRRLEDEVGLLRSITGGRRPPTGVASVAPSRSSSGRFPPRSRPPASPRTRRDQHLDDAPCARTAKAAFVLSPAPSTSHRRRSQQEMPPRDRRRSIDAQGVMDTERKCSAVMIRSRGEQGAGASERLVLRSTGGTPRVPLTPSERRHAQEYRDDVTSVRDLL